MMDTNEQNYLFNIVLWEPEIPNNTGNVGRTCVATRCRLHLVGPLGFEITDKHLKRAGLDYWKNLEWKQYESVSEVPVPKSRKPIYFSAHAKKSFFDYHYEQGDFLVFGKESVGIDKQIILENQENAYYIPTPGKVRSLNLATAVAIVIYEGYRQILHKSGTNITARQ